MKRACHECRFFDPLPEVHPEAGRLGRCVQAKERFDGDLVRNWDYPACRVFEGKVQKYKAGRRR